MDFPLPVPEELRSRVSPGTGVLLGVSGGVDSSVALALLHHLGCEVVTVTLKNFCTSEGVFGGEDDTSCCSLAAVEGARRTSARFGVKHWVGNVEDRFRREVIDPFVAEYRDGRTPNPCVGCNTTVRFPELARRADHLDLDLVATGHYARAEMTDEGPRLRRGVDPGKDQSYFLHGIGSDVLARCVFPLGWWTKDEVRRAAAALGLESARKPDSQEICFVPDDDRTFLFEDSPSTPGEIVDGDGRVIGTHRGLVHYTVGQRRGLGVAAAEPLYVTALDAAANRVVAGPRSALRRRRVRCDGWLDLAPDVAAPGDLTAQLRHRHGGVAVESWRRDGDEAIVQLAADAEGVAPGQFLVLYRDDEVLGGGRIVAAEPATAMSGRKDAP